MCSFCSLWALDFREVKSAQWSLWLHVQYEDITVFFFSWLGAVHQHNATSLCFICCKQHIKNRREYRERRTSARASARKCLKIHGNGALIIHTHTTLACTPTDTSDPVYWDERPGLCWYVKALSYLSPWNPSRLTSKVFILCIAGPVEAEEAIAAIETHVFIYIFAHDDCR